MLFKSRRIEAVSRYERALFHNFGFKQKFHTRDKGTPNFLRVRFEECVGVGSIYVLRKSVL